MWITLARVNQLFVLNFLPSITYKHYLISEICRPKNLILKKHNSTLMRTDILLPIYENLPRFQRHDYILCVGILSNRQKIVSPQSKSI